MKFVTFQYGNKVCAGLIHGNKVIDLANAFFMTYKKPFKFVDLLDFLLADGLERIKKIDWGVVKNDGRYAYPLSACKLLAPFLRPPKITAVGLNYKGHAKEQKLKPPDNPILFAKAANAVIATNEEIKIPFGISDKIDYEAELAVIIAKDGHNISRAEAKDYIFGYTIMNDVTARDIQADDKQWYRSKSFPTFAPLGPVVVTPDELDAGNLKITLKLNGDIKQDDNTSNLIFDVPALIEFISASCPVEPGEVISTGTPAGVGVFRKPKQFLKAGDRVDIEIQGIGTLTNFVK